MIRQIRRVRFDTCDCEWVVEMDAQDNPQHVDAPTPFSAGGAHSYAIFRDPNTGQEFDADATRPETLRSLARYYVQTYLPGTPLPTTPADIDVIVGIVNSLASGWTRRRDIREVPRFHAPQYVCPAHQAAGSATLAYEASRGENSRKNTLFTLAAVTEEKFAWRFDDARVLEVAIDGFTAVQKSTLQRVADQTFGVGKVRVI